MSGILDARPRVGYFFSGKSTMQVIGEKIKKKKVIEYKSIPILIREHTTVYDAICTMFLEDVGTLFVVNEDNYLTGVVSRKDLLRSAIGRQNLEGIPVNVIMTRMPNLVLAFPDETLHDAATKLIQYQIDALPVVRAVEKEPHEPAAYEIIGRITKTSITKAYVELGNEEI
jgi:CBS domain-containing protein